MNLILSLLLPATGAPACNTTEDAASDLRLALDALAAQADSPGDSARITLEGGGDLKPGAEIANLTVDLEGEIELLWSVGPSGEVTVELGEGGAASAGLDLGWSADAAQGVSERKGVVMTFESPEAARDFLAGLERGDPGALEDSPEISLGWESGESLSGEIELGGAGLNAPELFLGAEQERSREHTLSAGGLSTSDHQHAEAELSVPFAGREVTLSCREHLETDAQTGEGTLTRSASIELPVAELREVLQAGGEAELAEELAGALPELGGDGEALAGALAEAANDPALSAGSSLQVEVLWSWRLDAEGHLVSLGRQLALESREQLRGEAELKAGEVSGSATISRRDVVPP